MKKKKQINKFNVRINDYSDDSSILTTDQQFLLQDFLSLEQKGLIFREDNIMITDFADVPPGKMILSNVGKDYFKLLNLQEMPTEEFNFITSIK